VSVAKHARRISPRVWFYFKFLRYKFYNGEPEIWLVRRLPIDGKLAIDIGASIGLFSRALAKSAARVIAFEANPRVAEFTAQVASRNVEVKNVALSSKHGETTLRIPIDRRKNTVDDLATIEPTNALYCEPTITETVQTRKLDDYDYSDCAFIKIDVEGHEDAVLEGAMRLIERNRPILMIELVDIFKPGIVGRVVERLSNFDYSAYKFLDGCLRPLTRLETPTHSHVNHNFIFLPNGTNVPNLSLWDRLAIAMRLRFGR
jgi:FkbM family methyltransferase